MHPSWQLNCWLLRYSWSIACLRCFNYIFILNLTPHFSGLGKDDCKTRWESFKFWDLVLLMLEILRCILVKILIQICNYTDENSPQFNELGIQIFCCFIFSPQPLKKWFFLDFFVKVTPPGRFCIFVTKCLYFISRWINAMREATLP